MTMRRKAGRAASARRKQHRPATGRVARGKSQARATTEDARVSLPFEADLRTAYKQLPSYRLLVTYLQRFTLQASSRFKNLSDAEQTAISVVFHPRLRGPRPAPPQRWEPDLTQPVERHDASGRTVVVYPYEKRKSRRGGPSAFTLALAWVLMDQENRQASRDPRVAAVLGDLSKRLQCSLETLSRLSYVPREITGLLNLSAHASLDRRLEANAVRRLRGLQAHDRPIPSELVGLSPTDRRQERSWWAALGYDKDSHSLSRQGFWNEIVPPLMTALLGQPSWRNAARDAWQLLHARYPDLSLPNPEMIRKRYYSPRRG